MAVGVPAVSPAKGAFPEIIEPSGGGLIVPPARPELLADALEQLLFNDELRLRMGAMGQRWGSAGTCGLLMNFEVFSW